MANNLVLYSTKGAVAEIIMNRPDHRNAINVAMCEAMGEAFDKAEVDPAIRVILLAGNGPVFCAGMDLKAFQNGDGDAILFGKNGFANFVYRKRKKPVIAAVQGAALAGGFEVMLACDMVVGGESALFGLTEAKLGLVAGGGGAVRLAQYVPRMLANELLLSARPFPASEMFRWGLLNRVVADDRVLTEARALAEEVSRNSPLGLEASLEVSDHLFHTLHEEAWKLSDTRLYELLRTEDAQEGITAFFEKRPSEWKGK